MLARSVTLLALAALARSEPDPSSAPPPLSPRCMACALLTAALGDALAATRAELDQFKSAKEEAIGRVQKAQTRRWLKQEYGSSLYAGVEDAMDKVCALPALSAHTRDCQAVREDREDELVRATLDDSAPEFCAAAVPGCTAEDVVRAIAERRARIDEAPPAPPAPPKPAKGAASGKAAPAVVHIGAAVSSWEELVLDGERDVLVFVHASASAAVVRSDSDAAAAAPSEPEAPAAAATAAGRKGASGVSHKSSPLWAAYERVAKAVRSSAGLNATLRCTRLDMSVQRIAWPEALFEGDDDEACAPAVLLYAASAKEKPRALLHSCPDASDGGGRQASGAADGAPAAAQGEAGGAGEEGARTAAADAAALLERQLAVLVEGLHTYVTASSKAHVLALTAKATAAARAAGGKRKGGKAGKDEAAPMQEGDTSEGGSAEAAAAEAGAGKEEL